MVFHADGTLTAAAGAIDGVQLHPAIGDGVNSQDTTRVTVATPTVLVQGIAAKVQSGLSPKFPGMNLLSVIVPSGTTSGDQVRIQIQMGAITTTAQLAIAVRAHSPPLEIQIQLESERVDVLWNRGAVVSPQVVGLQHDTRAHRKLHTRFILPGCPAIEAGVVKYFHIYIRRTVKPALSVFILQAQAITVSGRKRLVRNEAELASVPVGNHEIPRQRIPRSGLQNAPVLVCGVAARQIGPVLVPRFKREIPVLVHVRLFPEAPSQNGLQSRFHEKGSFCAPVACSQDSAEGILKVKPNHRLQLQVDVRLGANFAARVLFGCGSRRYRENAQKYRTAAGQR